MEILKVHDLCKTYGKGEAEVEALKKVSFSLDKGEFAAIVGESGSGGALYVICNYWADYCCLYYSFSFKEIKRDC